MDLHPAEKNMLVKKNALQVPLVHHHVPYKKLHCDVYIYMYIDESLACWECEDLVTKFSGIPRVYIVCITLTTSGTNSSANSTHMSLLEVAPHSLSTTIALYF